MSPQMPRPSFRDLRRALEKDGWREVRQRGSHVQLKHPTKPGLVTLSDHRVTIEPRTVNSVLRQAGLTVDDLVRLLED